MAYATRQADTWAPQNTPLWWFYKILHDEERKEDLSPTQAIWYR